MMLEVIWRKIKDKMYTAQKKIMISFSLRQIPPTKRIKALHIRKIIQMEQKIIQMEQKLCKGIENVHRSQNKVHKRPMRLVLSSVTHYSIELPCLPCMALCGLDVALCGLVCHVWPCVALYGFVWPLYGLCMA